MDVDDDSGLALFRTANPQRFTVTERLDAVGPTCEANFLYKEGIGYSEIAEAEVAMDLQHSFFRRMCEYEVGVGCTTPGWPKHTDDNAADFAFADVFGTRVSGAQLLGAPGPENLASPIRSDAVMPLVLFDASVNKGVDA
jgi:hypothetical protein